VELDVKAERRLKPSGEGLDPLRLRKRAHTEEQGLELVPIVADGAGSLAGHELTQRVGADWGTKAEVEELGEAAPGLSAFIVLDLVEPHLSTSF